MMKTKSIHIATPEFKEDVVAQLSVEDILLCLQVIQVCQSRGAFKAEELSMIGMLHDRLNNFLNTIKPVVPVKVNAEPELDHQA